MKTDLILAVMKNVNVWDVDCYAKSLAQVGYDGRKVFFVENIAPDAAELLSSQGFELIPFTTPAAAMSVHFQTSRYIVAAEYLEQHAREFSRVLWSDVWDVVFQSDPFAWWDQNAGHSRILAAKEGWLIRDQEINDVWISRLVGPSEHEYLRGQEVYCAGTVMGDADAMLALMTWISSWVRSADSMQGLDQGMFNVLMRREPFRQWVRAPEPSEGFVCTCGPFLAPSDSSKWTVSPPVFDRDTGLVYTSEGKLFSVVHQYNRNNGPLNQDGAWCGILQRRYRQ